MATRAKPSDDLTPEQVAEGIKEAAKYTALKVPKAAPKTTKMAKKGARAVARQTRKVIRKQPPRIKRKASQLEMRAKSAAKGGKRESSVKVKAVIRKR